MYLPKGKTKKKRRNKTMKKIEIFERAMNEGGSLKDYGINATLFAAYRNLEYTGNEELDFADAIWDHDIAEIAETLRENGITEFTISSTFSGLIEIPAAFEKVGIKMAGLTEVNAGYTDFMTGEKARIPAIRMTL